MWRGNYPRRDMTSVSWRRCRRRAQDVLANAFTACELSPLRASRRGVHSCDAVGAPTVVSSPAATRTEGTPSCCSSSPPPSSLFGVCYCRDLFQVTSPLAVHTTQQAQQPALHHNRRGNLARAAASPQVCVTEARKALAARLATGPSPPFRKNPREEEQSEGGVRDAREWAAATAMPPMAEGLQRCAKLTLLAVRQTQRLIHAGLHEGGTQPLQTVAGAAPGRHDASTRAAVEEDRGVQWHAFFPRGQDDGALESFENEAAAVEEAVSGIRTATFGAALSAAETVSLLRWCGAALVELSDALEAAIVARQQGYEGVRTAKVDMAPPDATALRAPVELRGAPPATTTTPAHPPPPLSAAKDVSPLFSAFSEPQRAVDLIEVGALLLALLRSFLSILVEDVLVPEDALVDRDEDEAQLSNVAYNVTTRVATVLHDRLVGEVLRALAACSAVVPDSSVVSPDGDAEDALPFGVALVSYGLTNLAFSDDVVLLGMCSQRSTALRALALANGLYTHNTHLCEVVARPSADNGYASSASLSSFFDEAHSAAMTTTLVAEKGSYEVVMTLAYILAQHGQWHQCLQLFDAQASETDALRSRRELGHTQPWAETPLAGLLLRMALANAPRHAFPTWRETSAPATSHASRLLSLLPEYSQTSSAPTHSGVHTRHTANEEESHSSAFPHSHRGPTRTALLLHLVRLGILPSHPLSVAEYGALLRHIVRLQPLSPTKPTTHDADVSWVLSPANVWRHTRDLPHAIRTVLCLLGFQVLTRHGLTDSMSLEDLLVVLSLTRQTRRTRGRALAARRTQQERKRQRGSRAHGAERVQESTENEERAEEAAAEVETTLCGALPAFLLPATRPTPPTGQAHLVRLCEAYKAVCQSHGAHTFPDAPGLSRDNAANAREQPVVKRPLARRGTPPGGAVVMLSVVSQELLALLKAAHYERYASVFWEAVFTATGVVILHEGFTDDVVEMLETLAKALIRAVAAEATAPAEACQAAQDSATDAPTPRGKAAATAATPSQPSVMRSREQRIVSLLDPFVRLAPYVSPFTVALAVQSPAGRFFSPADCLRLLPYAPLGSHSQAQLLRRVAQHRHGIAETNGSTAAAAAASAGLLDTYVREGALQTRHAHSSSHSRTPARGLSLLARGPSASSSPSLFSLSAVAATTNTTAAAAARTHASSIIAEEQQMLSLLMERDWTRAWKRFHQAPPRVRAASAPHVVRLVIEADVWRDLGDAQVRPLIRLAVRSTRGMRVSGQALRGPGDGPTSSSPSGPTSPAGTVADGAVAFAEEMLRTTLAHGQWATGLHFHQVLSEEQPDLVKGNARARQYATLLCKGLMERTALARTIAEVLRATRAAAWAEASAHFVLYATGSTTPKADDASAAPTDATQATTPPGPAKKYPSLSPAMAQSILNTAMARVKEEQEASACPANGEKGVAGEHSRVTKAKDAWPFEVRVPAELETFAQATRYALLHTPQTRDYAFVWFPPTSLPVSMELRAELEESFGREFLVAHKLLVAGAAAAAAANTAMGEGAEGAADLTTLSPATNDEAQDARSFSSFSSVASSGASTLDVAPNAEAPTTALSLAPSRAQSLIEAARRRPDSIVHRPTHSVVKTNQELVLDALQVLHARRHWEASLAVYAHALETGSLPYQASATVLRTTLDGGAPWEVTLGCFEHMARRMRPDVLSTAAALEACAAGGQWAVALRVLKQSVLTQTTPAPRMVELAIHTALQCGVWARALQAAHQYRATRSPQLAHTVLNTYVAAKHWNDAVDYFYNCTVRGIRPLDASIELALVAAEAASEEYRRTASMVGAIASALEDLYTMSGAVLEHIVFVHRHGQWQVGATADEETSPWENAPQSGERSVDAGDFSFYSTTTDGALGAARHSDDRFRHVAASGEERRDVSSPETRQRFLRARASHAQRAYAFHADVADAHSAARDHTSEVGTRSTPWGHRRRQGGKRRHPQNERSDADADSSAAWNPLLLLDPPYWEVFTTDMSRHSTGVRSVSEEDGGATGAGRW